MDITVDDLGDLEDVVAEEDAGGLDMDSSSGENNSFDCWEDEDGNGEDEEAIEDEDDDEYDDDDDDDDVNKGDNGNDDDDADDDEDDDGDDVFCNDGKSLVWLDEGSDSLCEEEMFTPSPSSSWDVFDGSMKYLSPLKSMMPLC